MPMSHRTSTERASLATSLFPEASNLFAIIYKSYIADIQIDPKLTLSRTSPHWQRNCAESLPFMRREMSECYLPVHPSCRISFQQKEIRIYSNSKKLVINTGILDLKPRMQIVLLMFLSLWFLWQCFNIKC